ncbi:MAG: hypothetical protein E7652_03430 [Ruminococcaceae bacterium]|nr:hypothetical protein [Oscillospiraceae bacterium]
MRDDKATVQGEYLMYCDKPFVRQNNTICYGDMNDDYVLFMMILTNKTVEGAGGKKVEIPDQILVQIISTDLNKKPAERVAKQFNKSGLYDAMDIGLIWLDKLNKGKE